MVKVSARSVKNSAIAEPQATVFPSARKQILGEAASIEGNSWQLFLTDAKIEAADWKNIGQLAATGCNPNPFFNSPYLKPACQFLSNETVNFLALTSINNSGERLCLFAPVTIEKIPFIRKKVLQVWSHPYGPLGTPLLCSRNAAQTLSGFIDCLTNSEEPEFAAIIFKDLPKNTVFSSKLFASRTLASRSLRYSAYSLPANGCSASGSQEKTSPHRAHYTSTASLKSTPYRKPLQSIWNWKTPVGKAPKSRQS